MSSIVSRKSTSSSSVHDSSFENITKLENEMELDDSPTQSAPPPRKRSKGPKAIKKVKAPSLTENASSYGDLQMDAVGLTAEDIIVNTTRPSANTSVISVSERSFLALIVYQNTVGAAYYDTDNCVLNVFKEISETEAFSNSLKICLQCNPDKIIINAKQKSKLVEVLSETYFNDGENGIEVVSSSLFVYDLAKRRLQSLLPNSQIQSGTSYDHKDLWASSMLEFEDKNSIKAAGALLRYIDQNRIGIELEDSLIQAPILAITQVSVLSSLFVDNDTFLALQIFENENHPSSAKRGTHSSAKEGLSLFGQMDRTKSRLGSVRLKHWFKTPSRDVNILKQRQEAIGYFAKNENLDKVVALSDCLKNVKSLTKIIAKMSCSQIRVHDWNILYKTLYNLICILDLCNTIENGIEIVDLIRRIDFSGLKEILAMISKIIDFDESKNKNRFVVKHGIDKDLDEKKKVFNGLPELMTKVAEQELSTLDARVLECNVIYLPQLGYLLKLPHYPFIKEEDGYVLQNLEFMFVNNGTIHFKSEHTKELDRLLGDTQSEICDHESGIMHRLQNTILQFVELLLKALCIASDVDCLLSIASFAKDFNLVFPNITTEKTINIEKGRHILYEMCSKQFVSNDTEFDMENGYMKIISGPNACGKSVYLKQVALIIYMAHLGAPVPATYAEICVCDSIFTRIKCVESVSINLSTFVLDLNQITKAVNNATDRSLVIIDEFGKGTSQHDGVALFASILKYWVSKERRCPFVLAATHYHSIFKLKLLPPSSIVKYKTFEMEADDNGIIYLYKLIDGYCLHSQANHVARLAGISDTIIQRAEQILELSSRQMPIASYWKCDKIHTTVVKRFLSQDFHTTGNLQQFISFINNLKLTSKNAF